MFAYIQCRLNLLQIARSVQTESLSQWLKSDISHDVIENYDCTLFLRPSHTKTLLLFLGSKKCATNILDANN